MGEVLLFSLTAMLNPTLLTATTVMLLLPTPSRLMLGYLLGALTMSITLGIVIVFTLSGSQTVSTAEKKLNPAVDLALGGVLLVIAFVLRSGRPERYLEQRRERKGHEHEDKQPPLWQRAIGRGSARVTFAVGALLTLPGASYLAALISIHKLDYSTVETVVLVVLVNIIMLALIEIPLVGFAVAPQWTPGAVDRAKAWFSRNAAKAAVFGAAGLGTLLIIRGVITLISS